MKLLIGLGFFVVVMMESCGDIKKLQYLQGPLDPSRYSSINYKEPVIQPGDILSITVFSDNPVASAIYNQASVTASTTGGAGAVTGSGYLVDYNGNIQFHSLGNLAVKGHTRGEVSAIISEKLKPVLTNPYCQVRFNNFRVTVLGEVKNPSVFSIPSEKISVLEVIGLAGDLTDFARRDSIMVVREINNERKFGWLDVRRPDIFNSDFFYLQQNDVVVVHPTRKKITANDQLIVRNISIATSIISTIAIVLSVLKK